MSLPKQTELGARDARTFVLDGQQRLQALYLGLMGSYEGAELYVDVLSGFGNGMPDSGTKYFVRFLDGAKLKTLQASEPSRRMMKLKDFVKMQPDALKVFKTKRLPSDIGFPAGTPQLEHAKEVVQEIFTALRWEGRVPVIRIDDAATTAAECKSLDEVAEIFVRVNDGGTPLSRSDLIFTLMKSRWIEASAEIEAVCSAANSRGEFQVTKDFVLRCLMVFSNRSAKYDVSQIRRSDLMAEFRDIFPRAKNAILSTFDFLTQPSGAGIRTWRLLSGGQRADRGYNVLIPIALYLFLRSKQDIPEGERRRLRRFLYTAILSRFTVKYVETRADALAKIVRNAHTLHKEEFPAGDMVKAMGEAEIFVEPEDLLGRTNTLDPMLNILSGGQVDFVALYSANAPERDHIFPRSKLEAQGVDAARVNHFANMRLLSKLANILKSASDPLVALEGYDDQALRDDFLIPKSLLHYEDYDRFLEERSRLIKRRVADYLAP